MVFGVKRRNVPAVSLPQANSPGSDCSSPTHRRSLPLIQLTPGSRMRAFVVSQQGVTPRLEDWAEPASQADSSPVTVLAVGLGPTDLMRANGFFGPVAAPYV